MLLIINIARSSALTYAVKNIIILKENEDRGRERRMRTGEVTIFNFGNERKLEEMLEEVKFQVAEFKKAGLMIDEIAIKFLEAAKWQSDPEEGNFPVK